MVEPCAEHDGTRTPEVNSAFTRISCADCDVVFQYSLVCKMTCANAWSLGARRSSRPNVPKTDVCGGNFNACAGALHACDDDDDERMLFTNVGDGVNANFKSNLEQMQTEGRGEKNTRHRTPL